MKWESQDRQYCVVFRAQLTLQHGPNATLHQSRKFERAFLSCFQVNSYSSVKTQLQPHPLCKLFLSPPMRWESILLWAPIRNSHHDSVSPCVVVPTLSVSLLHDALYGISDSFLRPPPAPSLHPQRQTQSAGCINRHE